MTQQCVIKRDELVFKWCLERNIPILMVLSGGYQMCNAPCIADSLKNLADTFDLFKVSSDPNPPYLIDKVELRANMMNS